MWPKQLLGPCGAPPKHVTSSSIIQQSGMFSLLAETLTPLQSGMHGKAKHPQSRVFSLGSPLVKDDPTSYATTHPSLKYHQNWFQVSVIKLAWFNSYQTNTHCFVIIFPPSATHVPSFAVGIPKIGKKKIYWLSSSWLEMATPSPESGHHPATSIATVHLRTVDVRLATHLVQQSEIYSRDTQWVASFIKEKYVFHFLISQVKIMLLIM